MLLRTQMLAEQAIHGECRAPSESRTAKVALAGARRVALVRDGGACKDQHSTTPFPACVPALGLTQ